MMPNEEARQLIQKFKNDYKKITGDKIVVIESKTLIKPEFELIDSFVSAFIPEEYKTKYTSIKSSTKTRKTKMCDLRKVFITLCYDIGYSFADIGKYLNDQHHATIINQYYRCAFFIQQYEEFSSFYTEIAQKVKHDLRTFYSNTETSVNTKSILPVVVAKSESNNSSN